METRNQERRAMHFANGGSQLSAAVERSHSRTTSSHTDQLSHMNGENREFMEGDTNAAVICRAHGQPILYLCKTHRQTVCETCVRNSHQMPCRLVHIDDHESDDGAHHPEKLLSELKKAGHDLRKFRKTIDAHLLKVAGVLGDIEGSIKDTFEGERSRVGEMHRRKDAQAKREATEQIRKINQYLTLRLLKHKQEADAKYNLLKREADTMLLNLEKYKEQLSGLPRKMKELSLKRSSTLFELDQEIELMLQDHDVSDCPATPRSRVSMTIEGNASEVNVGGGVLEKLDTILRRINYSQTNTSAIGSLVGVQGEWGLVGTVNLRSSVRLPLLAGSISKYEVVISDVMRRTLYTVNLQTHEIVPTIKSKNLACVSDCASVGDKTFVCGNSFSTSVNFFSRSWKQRRCVLLQNVLATSGDPVQVCAMDDEGTILAAIYGQQEIYVIDERKGILKIITLEHCRTILDVHALASGDFVVQSGINQFTVLDENLQRKRVIQRPHWERATCTVDRSTNVLYITFKEKAKDNYAVDVVLPEGDVLSERIVEFPPARRADSSPRSHCLDFSTIVVCDGEQLCVYKKTLGVEDIQVLNRIPLRQSTTVENMVIDPSSSKRHTITEYYV